MDRYAFCHPGKIGDALYTLPSIHTICERDNVSATFYTSSACQQLERLFLYQDHIEEFIVPADYRISNEGQGIQPWKMHVKGNYKRVYQLGFEHFPRGALHKFIGATAGLTSVPDPYYKYPDISFYNEPYIVIGFSSLRSWPNMKTSYENLIKQCPIKVVQTGLPQDYLDAPCENKIGLDLLEVLSLLSQAIMFVGFYSGLLALANGFPDLPKIITLIHKGTGEQHGLHIANTYEIIHSQYLPIRPTDASVFEENLISTVLTKLEEQLNDR